MFRFLFLLLVAIAAIFLLIRHSRRQSIVGTKSRNRYFKKIAAELSFRTAGDDYFIQLEGTWKDTPVVLYPHNFHGPGSITLFYADTGIPVRDRTWIEPNLSLGRAILEWKRGEQFGFDVSGDPPLTESTLKSYQSKFPFIACTLPTRFIFSQYLSQTLGSWKNFVVLLVLNAGRKPHLDEIRNALDSVTQLVKNIRSGRIENRG
jgi:hypothetical protein